MKYRVNWLPQIGVKPYVFDVGSYEEGYRHIEVLANYDLHLMDNKLRADYCNTGTLEFMDEKLTRGEWFTCPENAEEWVEELNDLLARNAPIVESKPIPTSIEPMTLWRHHSGRVYLVLFVTNDDGSKEKYPQHVVYRGSNGKFWSGLASDWHRRMTRIKPGFVTYVQGRFFSVEVDGEIIKAPTWAKPDRLLRKPKSA